MVQLSPIDKLSGCNSSICTNRPIHTLSPIWTPRHRWSLGRTLDPPGAHSATRLSSALSTLFILVSGNSRIVNSRASIEVIDDTLVFEGRIRYARALSVRPIDAPPVTRWHELHSLAVSPPLVDLARHRHPGVLPLAKFDETCQQIAIDV